MSSNDKHPPESSQSSTPRNITKMDNENISNFTFSLLSNKNKVLSPTNNINASPVEFEQRSTEPYTFGQKEIEPEITTITGILSTGAKLDLEDVALKCDNTYYNSKENNFVVKRLLRRKKLFATFNIFKTGEITVTGVKNEKDLKHASRNLCKILIKNGFKNVKYKHPKIVNYSTKYDFELEIDLKKLSMKLKDKFNTYIKKKEMKISYEPEHFSGLIFRTEIPILSFTFFSSGKVNIVGAKNLKQIEKIKEILGDIEPIVVECKIKTSKVKKNETSDFNIIN